MNDAMTSVRKSASGRALKEVCDQGLVATCDKLLTENRKGLCKRRNHTVELILTIIRTRWASAGSV